MSRSAHSLSLYIAEHTRLVLKTKIVDNQSESSTKNPKLRQPIRIEHEKPIKLRQPIRIDNYVVSQSESSIVTRELSAKVVDPSRLVIAYPNT